MDRLTHVVIATGDVEGLKRFYEMVGLTVRQASAQWVEFDTAGATLALASDAGHRGIQLRFITDDMDARARDLEGRGVRLDAPGIQRYGWGAMASFADPDGRPITTWQPKHAPAPAGSGPLLSVVLNCRDLPATRAFYQNTLGFHVSVDSPWWVELSAGASGFGLHPRMDSGAEAHHAHDITIGLAMPDLAEWYEEARERGVEFAGPPHDRGFGTFADATDPDGNQITFRDVPIGESLEEQLAEPFEDEGTPQRAAIRRPVKKRVTAGSRLTLKPAHQAKRTPGAPRHPVKPSTRVASPRGTGPAGARQKPKRARDTKRARSKPAIGRLKKAERRTFKSKKESVANTSKSKPVKRASRPRAAKRTVVRARAGR